MFRESVSKAQELITEKPSNLTSNLIETIDYIAKSRDSELQFDKTIIAEVVSLSNAQTGEYYVRYQQGLFKAYASTVGTNYETGSNVYVKIPKGDFSAKKIIEGLTDINALLNEYHDYQQENLLEIYKCYPFNDEEEQNKEYSIMANASKDSEYFEKIIYEAKEPVEDDIIKNLSLSYPNIKISADFKTEFGQMEIVQGNYGLLVEFFCKNMHKEDNKIYVYTMKFDLSCFSGSLYDYFDFSPQYSLYKTEDIVLTSLKKITFFQENFDKKIQYETLQPNIFVKNISISFNDIQDKTETLYRVWVSSPQGLELDQDSSKITLRGHFLYANKDIMSQERCVCYWFKQNPEVVAGHVGYSPYGGNGWELISNNVDFNILTLKGSDVYQQLRIKFVLIYNNNLTFYYEIPKPIVKKYENRFAIVKKEEEDGSYLYLIDGRDTGDGSRPLTVEWYAQLDDGSYFRINNESTLKININEFLNYSKVYFQVSIVTEDGIKTPYDFTFTSPIKQGDVTVVFQGEDAFLYDSNGDISYSELKKEIVITPSITLGEKTFIKNSYWYWCNSNGEDSILTELNISPSSSMMSNIWVDELNRVHFKLQNKFKQDKKDNTFKLFIETIDGKSFYFNKTINFIKEGVQGAGGLTYSLIVSQCDENGNEIDLVPLNFNSKLNSWNQVFIKPKIYFEGNEIYNNFKIGYIDSNNGKVEKTYKIEYNINSTSSYFNCEQVKDRVYKIYSNSELNLEQVKKEYGQYFIQFLITISIAEGEKIDKVYQINYFHPITIGIDIELDKLDIKELPDQVIYDAGGYNPQVNNRYIKVYYEDELKTNIYSLTEDYLNIVNYYLKDEIYGIYPVDNYPGANFNGEKKSTNNNYGGDIVISHSSRVTGVSKEDENPYIPMGAFYIKLKGSELQNRILIQPVVMVLKNQLGSKDYVGTSIITAGINAEESVSLTKPAICLPSGNNSGDLKVALYGMGGAAGVYATNENNIIASWFNSIGGGLSDGYFQVGKATKQTSTYSLRRASNENEEEIHYMEIQDGIFKIEGNDRYSLISIGDDLQLKYIKNNPNEDFILSDVVFSENFKNTISTIFDNEHDGNIYIQDFPPENAKENSLWIDTSEDEKNKESR